MAASGVPQRPARTLRQGGGSAKARRRAARLAAVQALYQIQITGAAAETVLAEFFAHRLGREIDGDRYVAADPDLFSGIVRGTDDRRVDIARMIAGTLDSPTAFGRMEQLLSAILCAGTYELLANHAVHARIIVDDYIELAHAFFADREPAIVNGILDRLARTLREGEIDETEGDGAGRRE